jgi:cbb3-type cytochrome oxidase maturation protein
MNIVYFLLPIALLLGGGFLASFILNARRGQWDDLETPAHRILIDDEKSTKGSTL